MSAERVTQVLELRESSQIGAARRHAALLAERSGIGAKAASDLAIVVTELATNLVKHARHGQLLMDAVEGAVEVLSLDAGPGMDLEHCFRDGYSSGGSAGQGLGAVRRLSQQFHAHSDARGTALFASVGRPAPTRVAAVHVPVAGEIHCGDQWRVLPSHDGATFVVCDGLGHGSAAREAAMIALGAIEAHPEDPARALTLAHERSLGSRGSACAVVCWRAAAATLEMAGVGNVSATVLGRHAARGMASQSGTLGAACPRVVSGQFPAEPGALLVMHSDGMSARWSLDTYAGLRVRHPKIIAGVLYRDAGRQRDDATVVVARL